ncbi:FAD-binding oxidoreductase [Ornithinimicrobium sp. Y1847]|uniref:FAD-binding oxidoreductase n=1 Tax=Ornithinimicrobium sp. Y1847 TaxID=3405419 RepID=UPI003B673D91
MHSPFDLLAGTCALRDPEGADHVDGVPARVIASPRDVGEVSALLRACSAHNLAVVVRGRGSKLTWGHPPERVDVLLETTALDQLVEHSRGDLIATAGSGMPLARFQEHLADGGHQVVVDDLAHDTAAPTSTPATRGSTLGGAMATNVAGPRRLWTGALRDLIIGVRFVRADGTLAKAGGKVVKNVAGYDLAKLLTGSYGTLAVITEVTVRLHPLPAASAWVGTSVEPGRLDRVLATVIGSQLVPTAVELRVRPGVPAAVVTMLSGTTEGVQARATALQQVLTDLGCDARVHDAPPPWWASLLHPGQRGGQAPPDETRPVLVRATARLSGVGALARQIERVGGTAVGSAGVGVLHTTLPADDAAPAAVSSLRELTGSLGGSCVVLDAPPELRPRLDTWGPVPGLDLMRRVKAEFDPGRILAPGRFVGGI